jgi:gamma-butyrobetaine dioxygenase
VTIIDIDREPGLLRTRWSDGRTARFHHVWLRDNCWCTACRHPSIHERTLDTLAVSLDIQPAAASVDGGLLRIEWPDGHRSEYSGEWLEEHAYEPGFARPRPADRTPWRSTDLEPPPEVGYGEIVAGDEGLLRWLRQLREFGVSFVRGAPTEPGTVTALAERIAFLRNSNFGLLWDVVSKPVADSLAYTSVPLTPHTDLVSRSTQPGLQFLHCLVFEAVGGDSTLVDGMACAEELGRRDPAAFEVLTTTPVPYRYRSPDCDVTATSPMIRLDHRGELDEIRYSNALLAPLWCDPDRMPELYRAMHAFVSLLRSPEFTLRFRLRPGDVMCFDNHRVLHGRDAFDPQSGPRHLQGCYVDRDDFLSRLRLLESARPVPSPA